MEKVMTILNKQDVIDIRKDFFNEITQILIQPPDEIDKIFEQDQFYIAPNITNPKFYINSPDKGTLYYKFNINFFQKKFSFAYSIFLSGDWLKIGILFFNNELQSMPNNDSQREIDVVWDRTPDIVWRGTDKMMLEWRFEEKDFYINYVIRERFALQMRHVHFRVLRMMYDFSKKIAEH